MTPTETEAIRAVISKPSNRSLYDVLQFTGVRLSELRQLADTPGVFDPDRRTLLIRSGKPRATQKDRNVILCDRGVAAVEEYLNAPRVPSSPSAWQTNLIRWARAARLAVVPGGNSTAYNPCGITTRTTRKTLESWLLAVYPDRATHVALSQGHTEVTALRHYLNLSFTSEERCAIADQITGWLR